MTDPSFLPLFINEDIYLIENRETIQESKFLGGNRKGVLILISNPDARFLSVEEDDLLQKILLSVQLTYDEVAVVNVSHSKYDGIDFQKVLSFGVVVQSKLHHYQIEELEDKQWLLVDTLDEIRDDRSKKKKLWQHLQILFPE